MARKTWNIYYLVFYRKVLWCIFYSIDFYALFSPPVWEVTTMPLSVVLEIPIPDRLGVHALGLLS